MNLSVMLLEAGSPLSWTMIDIPPPTIAAAIIMNISTKAIDLLESEKRFLILIALPDVKNLIIPTPAVSERAGDKNTRWWIQVFAWKRRNRR